MVIDTIINKGYKRSELGAIPEDWDVKTLGEVIKIVGGFGFKSIYFSDKGPILLTPGNFKLNGGLYFNQQNIKRYSGPYSTGTAPLTGEIGGKA